MKRAGYIKTAKDSLTEKLFHDHTKINVRPKEGRIGCYFLTSLTPRVKPWVIQSSARIQTSHFINRTLKCYHSLENCCAVLCCGDAWFSILPSW